MVKIERDSSAVIKRVLGMMVPERIDKSGRVHPHQTVTDEYLRLQAADQISYYQTYHRYTGFLTNSVGYLADWY